MLNTTSVNSVHGAKFSQRFVKPLYDSYCFSNIPQTIEFLFTGEEQSALPMDVYGDLATRYDKVILLFVDAFGWRFFERYADTFPFLKKGASRGVVSKMTSQFPSTTTPHVTSIHTGLNVGQSGVYEWNYYEPLLDAIISPLLFSYAGERAPTGELLKDSLKSASIPVDAFFPRHTLYQRLQALGIASSIFQFHAYTPSSYSQVVCQGASIFPYKTLQEALTLLTKRVLSEAGIPAYYFLYFDNIDTQCHTYGPGSKQFEEAVDTFFTLLNQLFYMKVQGKVGKTLLIMTADHGQVEVDPCKTFYLNKEAAGIERYLQTNAQGNYLVPAGSPRDMFLHIKAEYVDEAVAFLRQLLEGRAEVFRIQELLAQHLFGMQEPSQVFLSRVGNVVILPYQNETVWWYEKGKFEMKFYGHHGGLTPQEMEIPLLLLPL